MVGPANEYASYVTSPSEYASQDYAAASTIWGANEGVFLGCLLETLQKDKEAPAIRLRIDPLSFRPGSKPKKPYGPFGPSFLASRRSPDEELEWLLVDRNGLPERHLPYFEWDEPALSADDSQEEFAAVCRRRVTVQSGGHPVEPDGQGGLLTMLVDPGEPHERKSARPRRWGAIWVRPLWAPLSGRFMFRVEAGNGSVHCSEEFDPEVILRTDPPRAIPLGDCSATDARPTDPDPPCPPSSRAQTEGRTR
jgi:hypothetical protein